MISRAVPATKGVAIDVPLYETYPLVELKSAAAMFTPGAVMSGLILPSAVGPRLENGARYGPP